MLGELDGHVHCTVGLVPLCLSFILGNQCLMGKAKIDFASYQKYITGLHTEGGEGYTGISPLQLEFPSPPELGQSPTLNTKNFLGEHATRPPRSHTNVPPINNPVCNPA